MHAAIASAAIGIAIERLELGRAGCPFEKSCRERLCPGFTGVGKFPRQRWNSMAASCRCLHLVSRDTESGILPQLRNTSASWRGDQMRRCSSVIAVQRDSEWLDQVRRLPRQVSRLVTPRQRIERRRPLRFRRVRTIGPEVPPTISPVPRRAGATPKSVWTRYNSRRLNMTICSMSPEVRTVSVWPSVDTS
jgi:hypothetical protein